MRFIHAIVLDKSEYDELKEYGMDEWDDLCSGDYIVHCLYSIDNQEILIHEDNTHQPVEVMIDNFFDGIEFCGRDVVVAKAIVIVDNGLAYNNDAVELCLIKGNYMEVV